MLTEDELTEVYDWVDEFALTRPKRNIARDFSDAVLAAEIVHAFIPKLVEMHNYPGMNSRAKKIYNWNTFKSIKYIQVANVRKGAQKDRICTQG